MIELLAFLSGSLLALGVASALVRPAALRRLERAAGTAEAEALPLKERLVRLLEPLARRVTTNDETRKRLVQAGFRDAGALSLFAGGRLALPVVLVLAVFFVSAALGVEPLTRLAGIVVAVGLGYVGPSFALDKLRGRRQRQIRLALPDALDLMVVCLEAGLTMAAGFARVAREFARSSPALCDELRLMTAEMQAGKAGADALRGLSDRVGIEDVSALVAMLVQSERFGTSVADALRIQSEGMRRDRLQRAEERAQKAAVRMLIPAGLLIFPATMIMILGPAGMMFMTAFK
jgi:tight adherence protein C